MDEIEQMISNRHSKYGDYEQNSILIEDIMLKLISTRQIPLHRPLQFAIRMIIVKLVRIVCGDQMHKDNFTDIIGYSHLALKHIKKCKETSHERK